MLDPHTLIVTASDRYAVPVEDYPRLVELMHDGSRKFIQGTDIAGANYIIRCAAIDSVLEYSQATLEYWERTKELERILGGSDD